MLTVTAMLVFCWADAAGQTNLLAKDPLTGLPLITTTHSVGNEPIQMPATVVCKSKMRGDFYRLQNIRVDAVVAWYSSHLSGFKKAEGHESGRSQIAFYNSDGTIVIFVTGEGANADAYSVAYQRYQPGISQKTITGLTQGKFVCP